MKKMECKQCRYQWQSRKKKPQACPKCKRYDWSEPNKKLKVEEER